MLTSEVIKKRRKKCLEIPNVCRNSNVLVIVVISQLMITIAWLSHFQNLEWVSLGLWSLYGQWVILLSTFLLCYARKSISNYNYWLGCCLVIGICLMSLLLVEVVTLYWMTGFSSIDLDYGRLFRLSLIVLLLSVGLLRFFEFLNTLEHRNKAEAQSRILALQSRIQPHFLFNSLNTISELTQTDSAQAEHAINALSMLFRASLENEHKRHSLESELTLCSRYVDLEHWRFGARLKINWSLHIESPRAWSVPKLLIQPLVENAIVHGQQADGSVEITIDARESNRHISIMVENSKSTCDSESKGHGIALDNIRERLQVLYDDQQTFRVKDSAEVYSVLVRIPKEPLR